jgi:hypothetical protein
MKRNRRGLVVIRTIACLEALFAVPNIDLDTATTPEENIFVGFDTRVTRQLVAGKICVMARRDEIIAQRERKVLRGSHFEGVTSRRLDVLDELPQVELGLSNEVSCRSIGILGLDVVHEDGDLFRRPFAAACDIAIVKLGDVAEKNLVKLLFDAFALSARVATAGRICC